MSNKKIPTAQEFWDINTRGYTFEDKGLYEAELLRKFAHLHVKAAIEVAIEEAPYGSSTDSVFYEDVVKALKDCYTLKNIK